MAKDAAGFEPLFRPHLVWGRLHTLALRQVWNGADWADVIPQSGAGPSSMPKARSVVSGKLRLSEDSLVMMGSTVEPSRELSCSIRAYIDDEGLGRSWSKYVQSSARSNALEGAADTIAGAVIKADQEFAVHPPTMTIIWSKLETQAKGSWHMDLSVQTELMDDLVADIRGGRCRSIRVCVAISPAFTNDRHGWATDPIDIGVLGTVDRDFAMVGGWLTSINWKVVRPTEPKPVDHASAAIVSLAKTLKWSAIVLIILLGFLLLVR